MRGMLKFFGRKSIKRFWIGGLLVALCGWGVAGGFNLSPAWSELTYPGPREVEFVYRARIPRISEGVEVIDVWIPLAKTSSEQEILRREVRSPLAYTIERESEYGNDILHIKLHPPLSEPAEIEIAYRARLLKEAPAANETALSPGQYDLYLKPRGLVIVDDEVRGRAADATQELGSVTDQGRGIYDHVIANMVYDKQTPGWGRGDTLRACDVGKGNCTDFHSLFISMARARSIPARFKIGFMIPGEPEGEIAGYHCWAEFFSGEEGWVPVDASEAWKQPAFVDEYFNVRDGIRFLVSTGRDIQLVPRQKNGPVNIFVYPYAEADGRIFSDIETDFLFREIKQEEAT